MQEPVDIKQAIVFGDARFHVCSQPSGGIVQKVLTDSTLIHRYK